MTDHAPVHFDAVLELLPWGRNVYTVIVLPDDLVARAAHASTRRVDGTIDDLLVNVGLNRADVTPWTFVYVGSGLQHRLGVRAGDAAAPAARARRGSRPARHPRAPDRRPRRVFARPVRSPARPSLLWAGHHDRDEADSR